MPEIIPIMIWNFPISVQNKTKSNKGISNVGKIIQYPYIKQRIQVSTQ